MVKKLIRKVLMNRTTIRLTGEYLLNSNEVVVDDDYDDQGDENND